MKSLEAEVTADHVQAVARAKKHMGEYFELDIQLSGLVDSAPSEPSLDYAGWTEITEIHYGGKVYDAQDFPREFIRALEKELA